MMKIQQLTVYLFAFFVTIGCSKEENDAPTPDPINFAGTFRSFSISDVDCDDTKNNGTKLAGEYGFCNKNGDTETCVRELVILREDSTFVIRVITRTETPTSIKGDPEDYPGTYTAKGRNLTVCFTAGSNCLTASLSQNNDELTIILENNGCHRTFLYRRDD